MSLRSGVIRGALSFGGARVVISLLNMAGILVLARLLTPADFGIVAITTVVLNIVMSITEASLQPALVQCREPTPSHVDTVWTMSLIRAGLIFCIFLLAAWPLANAYGDVRLIPAFMVAGVTGAFMEFFNPLLALATREMQFRPLILFQIIQKLLGLAIAIGLALWFVNFWAILIGNAIGAVFASLASYLLIPYRPRLALSRAKEIWQFSSWMFLNQICETLNWRFDQLVIGLTVSRVQLGVYSMADNLAVMPTRELTMPLRSALFPGMANLSEDLIRMRNSFLRAQTMVAMITIPAAVGLALLADPAVRVLLGEKWLASIPFVQIIAIAYALDPIITVVRPLVMAMGETKYLFFRQLLILSIRIPLILVGLALGGLVGAALGRAVSAVFNCLISLMVAKKLVGVSVWYQLRSHGMTLVGLLSMSIAVLVANNTFLPLLLSSPALKLLVLSAIGALTYCGTIYAIWIARRRKEGPVAELIVILSDLAKIPSARRTLRS